VGDISCDMRKESIPFCKELQEGKLVKEE